MTVYWFVFSLLSSSAVLSVFLGKRELKVILAFLNFFVLLLVIGLRDQTGSDWNHYKSYYESLGLETLENHFEVGYFAFAKALNYLDLNYASFLFISTLFYLLLLFYAFSGYGFVNVISLIFFCSHLLPLMGQARQVIALSLCLVAGKLLLANRGFSFLLTTLIASLFHKSAIIFLLSYWAVNYKVKVNHVLIVALAGAFIFTYSQDFINTIPLIEIISHDISHQLITYIVSEENTPIFYVDDLQVVILVYVKRILFGLIFLYASKYITQYRSEYNRFLNLYILSVVIFLFLYGTFPAIAIRLALYFYIYDVFLLAIILANARGLYKISILVVIVVICLQRLSVPLLNDADFLVPYKGLLFIGNNESKSMPH